MKKITILLFITTAIIFAQEEKSIKLKSAPIDSTREKIFLDKISVTGTLEKPQAVFVLPGQTPEIDDIQIKRSFIKELFRPVEKLDDVKQQKAEKSLIKQPD